MGRCQIRCPSYLRLYLRLLFISSIDANITLDSFEDPSNGAPGFAALVKNFNGSLNLAITLRNNAADSPFQMQVQNNNAPTSVSLDSYYQGSFSVETKMSRVIVKDTARDDPAKAKRPRTLVYDQQLSDYAAGWVGWGSRPMAGSHAVQSCLEIESALSPATLTFGPG